MQEMPKQAQPQNHNALNMVKFGLMIAGAILAIWTFRGLIHSLWMGATLLGAAFAGFKAHQLYHYLCGPKQPALGEDTTMALPMNKQLALPKPKTEKELKRELKQLKASMAV